MIPRSIRAFYQPFMMRFPTHTCRINSYFFMIGVHSIPIFDIIPEHYIMSHWIIVNSNYISGPHVCAYGQIKLLNKYMCPYVAVLAQYILS